VGWSQATQAGSPQTWLVSVQSAQLGPQWVSLSRPVPQSLHTPAYAEELRLHLLKSTYRMQRTDHEELYTAAETARERLNIDAPLTLYMAQQSGGSNASVLYLPGEMHVAFHGTILDGLTTEERIALLGHEISHYLLLEREQSRYRTADELLSALVNDRDTQPAHLESYRAFSLFLEVFCDRGSLIACRNLHAAVSMLVKAETGLKNVSAESYLRQTDEIFAQDSNASTEGLSHPEAFIRTRALNVWTESPETAEAEIDHLIRGDASADTLDLLRQVELCEITRNLLQRLLNERWFRTQSVLNHARLYFDDTPPEPVADPPAVQLPADKKLRQYFACVLLDFATCDRSIEEPALAHTYLISAQLGFQPVFTEMLRKELKLKVRQIGALQDRATEIVERARKEVCAS